MKVCDQHNEKRAIDTIHVVSDDTYLDVCDECKYAVMNFLNGATKELEHKDKKSFVQKVLGR